MGLLLITVPALLRFDWSIGSHCYQNMFAFGLTLTYPQSSSGIVDWQSVGVRSCRMKMSARRANMFGRLDIFFQSSNFFTRQSSSVVAFVVFVELWYELFVVLQRWMMVFHVCFLKKVVEGGVRVRKKKKKSTYCRSNVVIHVWGSFNFFSVGKASWAVKG